MLNLSGNALGDEGIGELAKAKGLRSLRSLRLTNNSIKKDGMKALADARLLETVEELSLEHNKFQTEGGKALAASKHLKSLRVLRLGHNWLGVLGMKALLENPAVAATIEVVDNAMNNFGDAVFQTFLKSKTLKLTHLTIEGANAEEVSALAASPRASSLRNLFVWGLDDAGADHLAASKLLTGLGELNVVGLRPRSETPAAVRSRRPSARASRFDGELPCTIAAMLLTSPSRALRHTPHRRLRPDPERRAPSRAVAVARRAAWLWQHESLGRKVAAYLDARGLPFKVRYENHDAIHAILDYETNIQGEMEVQAFLWANGSSSPAGRSPLRHWRYPPPRAMGRDEPRVPPGRELAAPIEESRLPFRLRRGVHQRPRCPRAGRSRMKWAGLALIVTLAAAASLVTACRKVSCLDPPEKEREETDISKMDEDFQPDGHRQRARIPTLCRSLLEPG